jgi:hypothetical protein
MLEDILKKRQQTVQYNHLKLPDKKVAENIIIKSFELTASKQNLYPYTIHVLGPEQKEYKKTFFEIIKHQPGGGNNFNVQQAPYCLIFTTRLITNPDPIILDRIKRGHSYLECDPKKYNINLPGVSLEIGMFAKVLSSLALEKDMDVSYTGCLPPYEKNKELWKKLPFIKDIVVFSMQFGYRFSDYSFKLRKEKKPKINEVINWV